MIETTKSWRKPVIKILVMLKKIIFVVLVFLACFNVVKANSHVVINEIMYDLSGTDTGREWVEVFNDGTDSVDLSKWKFFEAGVNHGLTTSQGSSTLAPGSYAIIADVPTKFLLDWPSFSGTLLDSSFSLSNTGETIVLRDQTSSDIDSVSYTKDIGAAGDGLSLQKNGSSWIAATPTPGALNKSSAEISPMPNGGGDTATTTDNGSGGGTAGDYSTGGDASVLDSPAELSGGIPAPPVAASAGRKRLAAVGAPVTFLARLSGFAELTGSGPAQIDWTFGDGAAASGRSVWHSYSVPGTYQVVLNVRQGESLAVSRTTVEVFAPVVSLVAANSNSFTLANTGPRETNLARWSVHTNNAYFVFPEDTIITAGTRLTVPATISRLGLDGRQSLTLYRPDGQVVSTLMTNSASLTSLPVGTSSTSSLATTLADLSGRLATRVSRPTHNAEGPKSPAVVPTVVPAPTSTVVLGEPKKLSWWQKLFQ